MPNQELINYIKTELEKGTDKGIITANLLSQGWREQQIEEAFASVKITSSTNIVQSQPVKQIQSTDQSQAIFLPRFFSLLKESWKFFMFKLNNYVFIYILGSLMMGFSIIAVVAIYFISLSYFAALNVVYIPVIVLIFTIPVLMLIFNGWTNLALITSINNEQKVILTFRTVFSRLFPFLGLTILSTVIIIIGYGFLIIPGIIASLMFIFAPYIFVFERKSIIQSLKLSKEYVKPYMFEIFVRIVEFYFIIGIISLVINFVPVVGSLLAQLFIAPLTVVFFYIFYIKVKGLNGQKISNPLPKRVRYEVFGLLGIFLILLILFLSFFILNIFKNPENFKSLLNLNKPIPSSTPIVTPIPTKSAQLTNLKLCSQCGGKYNQEIWLEKDSVCDKSSIEETSVWYNLECGCTGGTITDTRSLACETKQKLCSQCSTKWRYVMENWIENDSICDRSSVDKEVINSGGLSGQVDGVWYNINCGCGLTTSQDLSFSRFCTSSEKPTLTPQNNTPTLAPIQ